EERGEQNECGGLGQVPRGTGRRRCPPQEVFRSGGDGQNGRLEEERRERKRETRHQRPELQRLPPREREGAAVDDGDLDRGEEQEPRAEKRGLRRTLRDRRLCEEFHKLFEKKEIQGREDLPRGERGGGERMCGKQECRDRKRHQPRGPK